MIDVVSPKLFDKNRVTAGLTKRMVAEFPPYGISFGVTESISEEQVGKYRHILCSQLKIGEDKLFTAKQVHGKDIIEVGQDVAEGVEADGFVTKEKVICLMVKLADCCGVVCYDPSNHVAGIIHSGWRGTHKNIVSELCRKMTNCYGTKPSDLMVWISPCASVASYEVGWDVAQYFPKARTKSQSKYFIDIRKQIHYQLMRCGVETDNVETSTLCTIADEQLHSYRRDGMLSGRMGCYVVLS